MSAVAGLDVSSVGAGLGNQVSSMVTVGVALLGALVVVLAFRFLRSMLGYAGASGSALGSLDEQSQAAIDWAGDQGGVVGAVDPYAADYEAWQNRSAEQVASDDRVLQDAEALDETFRPGGDNYAGGGEESSRAASVASWESRADALIAERGGDEYVDGLVQDGEALDESFRPGGENYVGDGD